MLSRTKAACRSIGILSLLYLAWSTFAPVQARTRAIPRVDVPIYDFSETGWELHGPATIDTCGSLFPSALALDAAKDSYIGSIAHHLLMPLRKDTTYVAYAWVNGDEASEDTPLYIGVFMEGQTAFLARIVRSEINPGWQRVALGTFVDISPTFYPNRRLSLFTLNYDETGDGDNIGHGKWVVSQVGFEEVPW